MSLTTPLKEPQVNQPLPRRVFLMTLAAASGTTLTTGAQAQALLDEKDAQVAGAGWCSAWAKKA